MNEQMILIWHNEQGMDLVENILAKHFLYLFPKRLVHLLQLIKSKGVDSKFFHDFTTYVLLIQHPKKDLE
jgi:hypothetical protein